MLAAFLDHRLIPNIWVTDPKNLQGKLGKSYGLPSYEVAQRVRYALPRIG